MRVSGSISLGARAVYVKFPVRSRQCKSLPMYVRKFLTGRRCQIVYCHCHALAAICFLSLACIDLGPHIGTICFLFLACIDLGPYRTHGSQPQFIRNCLCGNNGGSHKYKIANVATMVVHNCLCGNCGGFAFSILLASRALPDIRFAAAVHTKLLMPRWWFIQNCLCGKW